MKSKLEKLFQTTRPIIGMIHFPPLVGHPNYPGLNYITAKIIKETSILSQAGFDAIMVENNYDIPHQEFVSPEKTAMLTYLTNLVCYNTKLPIGINTLWNDYRTSLGICATTRASFIRIPAFVDTVKTSYGVIKQRAKSVIKLRKKLSAKNIFILADVQVKHAQMINQRKTLKQSIQQAISNHADGIIITGNWTGDSPKLNDLKLARQITENNFPIFVGSGATQDNVNKLLKYTTGIIVGTAIKQGKVQDKTQETNLKPFQYSISSSKAKKFIKSCVASI